MKYIKIRFIFYLVIIIFSTILFHFIFSRLNNLQNLTSSAQSSESIKFYVSPSGSDSNTGSESAPFKTINKARDYIRTINSNMSQNIEVYIRAGTYQLDSTLEFLPQDSGTNQFTITYRNYPNEEPILSGGKTITGFVQEGNIWKVFLGKNIDTRQIYVNGNRAIRARSVGALPNSIKTSNGFTTTQSNISSWTNIKNVEVVYNSFWKQPRCLIDRVVGKEVILQQPCFNNAQKHGSGVSTPSWVENSFELLDSKGEWYLNKTTGWLYYMPKDNESILNTEIVVPQLQTLLFLNGNESQSVSNLSFEGLTFRFASWTEINSNEGFVQITQDYRITGNQNPNLPPYLFTVTPGNIYLKYVNNVGLLKNIFEHMGATAIYLGGGSKNSKIVGNRITDISATGIHIGDIDKYASDLAENFQTLFNNINNNYISRIGSEFQGSPAIFMAYAANTTIANNLLEDLPYSGIHLGWGWGDVGPTYEKRHRIIANRINNYMQVMEDGGGIHSISDFKGAVYQGNLITNQRNKILGGAMYLDQGSQNITIEGNVLYSNLKNYLYNPYNVRAITVLNNYEVSTGNAVTIMRDAGLQPIYRYLRGDVSSVSVVDHSAIVNFVNHSDKKDWIGVFNVTSDDTQPLDWFWLNGQKSTAPFLPPVNGSISFNNLSDGTYSVRYVHEGTANSGHITAGYPLQIGLQNTPSPTPNNIKITSVTQDKGVISASYSYSSSSPNDWIGLFSPTSDDTNPIKWLWLDGSKSTVPSIILQSGTLKFPVVPSGEYDVRYIVAGTALAGHITPGVRIQVTGSIAITPTPTPTPSTFSFTGSASNGIITAYYNNINATNKDWVGVFNRNDDDTKPLDWNWLDGTKITQPQNVTTSGYINFKQLTSGTYDVRYVVAGTAVAGHISDGVLVNW